MAGISKDFNASAKWKDIARKIKNEKSKHNIPDKKMNSIEIKKILDEVKKMQIDPPTASDNKNALKKEAKQGEGEKDTRGSSRKPRHEEGNGTAKADKPSTPSAAEHAGKKPKK